MRLAARHAIYPLAMTAVVVLGACARGDFDEADSSLLESDVPCEVRRILVNKCQECHATAPRFGAPMALVARADLLAPAKSDPSQSVLERVVARVQDDAHPMPQAPNPRLSAADIATLRAWRDSGAPPQLTSQACTAAPQSNAGVSNCEPDMQIAPAHPWAMPAAHDQYVCYGVDLQPASDRHIVTIKPRIDNTKIVHHVVLLVSDTAVSPEPTPCNPVANFTQRMAYAWAPGGGGLTLPDDVGYALPADQPTHFVVQIHYNNASGATDETDASGISLCTDTPRANVADVLAFGTHDIKIPARASVERNCHYALPKSMEGRHFFAVFPHMHNLGTSIGMSITHSGNTRATQSLGSLATWDFQNQPWLSVDAVGSEKDVINTHCAYANPSDQLVRFGENTADEMCYLFTMYYPRDPDLAWVVPALIATCDK